MSTNCKHSTCQGEFCRRPKKQAKRTPIKRISKKRGKELRIKKTIRELDHLLYLEIWEERPHICAETTGLIEEPFSTLLFHHVLPKGVNKYKKYRHCKWNILIVSASTHQQVEKDIDKCPNIKRYQDFIIKKYINNEKV